MTVMNVDGGHWAVGDCATWWSKVSVLRRLLAQGYRSNLSAMETNS